MDDFYWEIETFDGDTIEVPPVAVDVIKRRMDAKQPIHLKSRGSLPSNQIKSFRPTDKLYSQQQLLESEVAQAFDEPVMIDDMTVACKWVKRYTTPQKWEKEFSPKGFKRLDDYNGMVTIAILKPIHLIDTSKTPYCSDVEINQLERARSKQ